MSSVLGRGKSKRGSSLVNSVVEAWLRFCFCPKTHAQASMCELVRYHGAKSVIIFPQSCAFLTNCFAQLKHNFKVVFLIKRTTLWQDFMIHHSIAIEENGEQNIFSILVLLVNWAQCQSHTSIIRHHLWPFEQIWIVVSDVHAKLDKICIFGTIFAAVRFLPKTSLKIAWHEPNDMSTSSTTSQQ